MIRALFAGLAVILVWFFDFPDARAMAEDGPALVQRLGCLRCHRWDGVKILEEGPSLDFAGDKLRPAWVDAFLQDPSGSRMPGNALSTEGRSQISRFLRTLREDKPRGRSGSGDPSRGEKLYEENRCGTCHPSEVDLSATPAKVRRDWLVDFLMNPQEAQPGARMPQYPLGRGEAEDLAAYLLVGGEPEVESDSSPAGLTAFLEAGCIACHRIGRVQGKELTKIIHKRDRFGVHLTGKSDVPRLALSAAEQAAIWATLDQWIAGGPGGGGAFGPTDFGKYWSLPVPSQGDPPGQWTGLEGSLSPSACGVCHPMQHGDWASSLHARAYSPGFRAELESTGDPTCLECHAPLSEQSADENLRRRGITCAGCHVRRHRRHGPPLRRSDARPFGAQRPHGGAELVDYFEDSKFCIACHQFEEGGVELNGKPIMNTYAEYLESPAAREGETCQSCHMPDRRHLWRGIHAPEMVRDALRVEASEDGTISITNLAGHRVPTYVVPRIVLMAWLEDAEGKEIPASRKSWKIEREIELMGMASDREISDTRLRPGEIRKYTYGEKSAKAATFVVAIDVEPDAFYSNLYRQRLEASDLEPDMRDLYQEALIHPMTPPYRLLTRRVSLP